MREEVLFPDYWVYFKASMSAFLNFKSILFPDYWVYFKAILLKQKHTFGGEFPDYWVYFKAGTHLICLCLNFVISRLLSLF